MIWTVVALAGDHHGIGGRAYDWRPLTQFESIYHCEAAAQSLAITNRYRCVKTK